MSVEAPRAFPEVNQVGTFEGAVGWTYQSPFPLASRLNRAASDWASTGGVGAGKWWLTL